jgi:uncharacterized membrane protein YqjE
MTHDFDRLFNVLYDGTCDTVFHHSKTEKRSFDSSCWVNGNIFMFPSKRPEHARLILTSDPHSKRVLFRGMATNNAALDRQSESLVSLVGRLTDELTQLFDAKLELLKAELKREATAYVIGVGLVLIGVVIATVGFALLNVALAFWISTLFETMHWNPAARYGFGFAITALLYLVIGAIIVVIAKNRLAQQRLAPKSTAELKRDKEFLKEL